ncbi:sporulation protein YqfD [Dorea formicigenerans]|uniref:sporulation protein YqfD n=1 Tax=Dorea formicigenerans TaxID=39486 RepID=UPI0032C0D048
MLLKIYQYIRGYVRIRITGHRMERFINACNYRKIKIWDLSASDGSYEMNLWVKDFKKLRHISHKTSTKITIVKKYGLPFYLFDHRRRKLFFAGIFAATVLLLIMSGYIWDIEILGTHTQTEEVIRTFLKENHVNTGIRRGNIDCDRIVKDIRKGFDDIIWVSASIEGTRLIIQIKENEDAKIDNKTDNKTDIKEDIYPNSDAGTDLVSDCTGTIVRIITRKGIPMVREGTSVNPGDILVSGQIPILNDAKEITGYESCHSDADIFIQTQIHYENTLPRKYIKKTSVKFPRLFYLYFRIGKYRLSPFFIWSPYEHYSKSTMESRLKLLDHFYLPVYIGVVGLTPYKPVMKKYTDQQLQDKLNRYFLRYCEDLDKKGVEIIQNDVKIDTGSKEGSISGTLTIICNTGQSRQSEIPQLPNDPEEQIEQLGE